MKSLNHCIVAAQVYAVIAVLMTATAQGADDDKIARGQYLVAIANCSNCHTPGVFDGTPDMTRFLGGSDTAFEVPTVGAFVGGNITPDQETGIGGWSIEEIVTLLQYGERRDHSLLQPGIHSNRYKDITKEDLTAIATYLKSIPAVKNRVPGPFNSGDKVTTSLIRRLPPGETAQ